MFKFFRQYNKIILVVGAAFLMVAFLIQPVLSMFMTSPGDQPIGSVNGEELTVADRQTAAAEVQLLSDLHPVLGISAQTLARADGQFDPEMWLLMLHDARRLGLSASSGAVYDILQQLGIEEARIHQAASRFGASDDLVYQAVRHWLMLQQYQSLMLGEEHVAPLEKVMRLMQIMSLQRYAQQALQQGDYQSVFQVQQAMQNAESPDGSVRLSEPLVQWYLSEQQATVSGQTLLVSAEAYLDEVEAPTEAELEALFEAHRDDLPGEGEPFGFGYKYPDRVKLEWLAFPIGELRDHVEVAYHEALAYYRQNQDEFRIEPSEDAAPNEDEDATADDAAQDAQTENEPTEDAEPTVQPFNEVRSEIMDRLREQEAEQLAQRMVNAAQSELFTQMRRLGTQGGYHQIPDDFEPTSLEAVADRLEAQFGVRPRIERRVDAWVPTERWGGLSGLGQSWVQDRRDARFPAYVQSAPELVPDEANPLAGLRLQAEAPSRPMVGPDGSRYLFRLTEAQPSHAPESLDEVRQQVVEDARRQAAYELLLEQQAAWVDRAVAEGFATLAEQEHVSQRAIDSIPRRRAGMRGELSVPRVPGVGTHAGFVDALFETAQRVSDRGREDVDAAPEAERTGAVAIDPRMSLAIYRVDAYRPLSRSQFEQMAERAPIDQQLTRLLLGDSGAEALSKAAVAQRVGFEAVEQADREAPAQPQQPQRRPGSL